MASAEGGSMTSGVRYGEGSPFFNRLGVWGSVVSSPSGVRARAPAVNGFFWRILKPSCTYMTKIRGGQFALASPTPNSGGGPDISNVK